MDPLVPHVHVHVDMWLSQIDLIRFKEFGAPPNAVMGDFVFSHTSEALKLSWLRVTAGPSRHAAQAQVARAAPG